MADVLRVESQVAGAELLLTRATNAAAVAEQTLRTLMHDDAGRAYTVGEDVTADVAPAGEPAAVAPLAPLFAEAAERRLELRALDEGAGSARQQATVARTAGLPRLDAVGNAVYANPNPRVIPLQDSYRGTWDATIQLSWAPTDLATTEASRRVALARAAELEAERAALLDGIRLEVAQTSRAVAEARAAVATSRRGLTSAEESYRVRRVLYQNGRATSVELTDAETELTRGRLEVDRRGDRPPHRPGPPDPRPRPRRRSTRKDSAPRHPDSSRHSRLAPFSSPICGYVDPSGCSIPVTSPLAC